MTTANRSSAADDGSDTPMANDGSRPGGAVKNGGNARPQAAPMPHIEDLTRAPDDIVANQSIKRLLQEAESALRQSQASREFNRPAVSLKDYMRAYTIVVTTIPSHAEYPTLKITAGDAARAHRTLMMRLKQENDTYEVMKHEIIADNKRTGVKPTARARPAQQNGHPANQTNGHAKTSPAKSKPAVHPKPSALHGNAIAANQQADLRARFASLRGPQSPPAQDPRINTQAIGAKPAGPRQMPSQRSDIAVDPSLSALPKMPAATYSPSTSAPRGSFARTPSSVSKLSIAQQQQQQQRAHGASQSQSDTSSASKHAIDIPKGDQITAEELLTGMKLGSILIIDVRDREYFNEGHIMSTSIICVEPNVLLRDNISATDVSESLVLSPVIEQEHFDVRDEYDLVVLYNQSSDQFDDRSKNPDDVAMASLQRALLYLSYGFDLKNPPKILKGGLDAWVDLMGSGSLKSTPDEDFKPLPRQRGRPIPGRRQTRYVSKPLPVDDVRGWQDTVHKEGQGFATATSDVLRRLPIQHSVMESMSSPAYAQSQSGYGSSHQVDLYSDLPAPPQRPAPAVQRQSYSSLPKGADGHGHHDSADNLAVQYSGKRGTKPAEQVSGDGVRYVTGLNNPQNWCYANSTLQSLLVSPFFGKALGESEWMKDYTAPRKEGEKIDHPQLMIRILSNLFHWMGTGKFKTMKAQTLMDYSKHLCKSNPHALQFGGSAQQDAQEFMSFLMAELHDETNSVRNNPGQAQKPDTQNQSLLQAASQYWSSHLQYNQSIVDRHWRGLDLSSVECLDCHNYTHTFAPFEWVPVPVPTGRVSTLEQALKEYNADNILDDFECDGCGKRTRATQRMSLARMPELLCLSLRRFDYNQASKDVRKSPATITWDFNDLDMTPYFLAGSNAPGSGADAGFKGPFRYECYAVIVHMGSRIDNGHYYSYIRDSSTRDPYAWLCCNDTAVSRVRIGSGDKHDIASQVFKEGRDAVPYLLFFRRKGGS